MTIVSPYIEGRTEMRKSYGTPSISSAQLPSCGKRLSPTSSRPRTFTRTERFGAMEEERQKRSESSPSFRNRTRTKEAPGSIWTSLALSAAACRMIFFSTTSAPPRSSSMRPPPSYYQRFFLIIA